MYNFVDQACVYIHCELIFDVHIWDMQSVHEQLHVPCNDNIIKQKRIFMGEHNFLNELGGVGKTNTKCQHLVVLF
jgi:hypothetical protein